MWTVIGIVAFLLALLFSIAWHEAGHLTFAKLFNVRTSQYMVGFGRTAWSRQVGETEYGIKAIPLGGYIRMIGMVPPGKDGRQKITTTAMGATGFVRNIVEETRAGDRSQVTAADEGRQFYQLHPFKRIIIMAAGPVMNLILAVGIFAILLVGIGVPTPTTTVATVSQCVIPAAAADQTQRTECTPTDPDTPAALAGLLPGDTITAFNGTPITDWAQLTGLIRASAGQTVQIEYERDGQQYIKAVAIVQTQRPVVNDQGEQVGVEPAGFLGISTTAPYQPQSIGAAVTRTGQFIGAAAGAVVAIPARIPALWSAIFDGQERDLNSPVGIVGAGRIGGEILESDNTTTQDKFVLFLNLVAGFNMSLFLLNMLPLLPLDGGHILGAVIEWVRRGWAKLRGKADPGPFDVAKLMPVAYVVALLFIGLTALTLVADLVNPVKLFG
ncbi:MAG TPA: site-2 protease family protein [Candidatus Limnocylindria bacterium]|jgi:membrane-associated protease RseP (regulator of RpoE activity)|nr:site-2 protease family protein [Candidatus Limnocylindria bacterium]